jgi:hypothetical protein
MKSKRKTSDVARGIVCGLVLVAVACGDTTGVDGQTEGVGEAGVQAADISEPAVTSAVNLPDTRPEAPPDEYMHTPLGRFHRSCVSEVPDGAEIDERGRIRGRGAISGQSDRCPYKAFRAKRNVEAEGRLPTVNGWISRIYAVAPTPPSGHRWFNGMTSTVTVPSNPTNRNGQLLYFFSSFLPFSNNMIIQPVLQWGIGPAGGGTKWGAAAWYVDEGDLVKHSPLRDVSAGDVLIGQIGALGGSCTNAGVCRWGVAFSRNGSGLTSMVVQATEPFTIVDKAVLEADDLDFCQQLPSSNAVVFRNVFVTQPWNSFNDWTDVTARLRWTSKIWTVTPSCNYGTVAPNPNVGVLTFTAQ